MSDVVRVVKRQQQSFNTCFDAHKDELSSSEGVAYMRVTILSSGKVSVAQSDLPGRVGQCLEARGRSLRFPAHRDKEVTLSLPFAYEIKR